jgi:hypothetical protein
VVAPEGAEANHATMPPVVITAPPAPSSSVRRDSTRARPGVTASGSRGSGSAGRGDWDGPGGGNGVDTIAPISVRRSRTRGW